MAKRLLPPDADMHALWDACEASPTRVQALLADRYGIAVSRQAIANWVAKRDAPGRRRATPRYGTIPWEIAPAHRTLWAAQMLRLHGKVLSGAPLSDWQQSRLPSLERWLARHDEDGTCIHYDPETEEGFFTVPRRPGIDRYTRNPDVQ